MYGKIKYKILTIARAIVFGNLISNKIKNNFCK